MLRVTLLVAALAAGCGGSDDDPHAVVDCNDDAWRESGFQRDECERGCAQGHDMPAGSFEPDNSCWGFHGDRDPGTQMPIRTACPTTYVSTFDGQRGCCTPAPATEPVHFVECEAQ